MIDKCGLIKRLSSLHEKATAGAFLHGTRVGRVLAALKRARPRQLARYTHPWLRANWLMKGMSGRFPWYA